MLVSSFLFGRDRGGIAGPGSGDLPHERMIFTFSEHHSTFTHHSNYERLRMIAGINPKESS
jgi:hypothetical protein